MRGGTHGPLVGTLGGVSRLAPGPPMFTPARRTTTEPAGTHSLESAWVGFARFPTQALRPRPCPCFGWGESPAAHVTALRPFQARTGQGIFY